MIIVMAHTASEADIKAVVDRVHEIGLKTELSRGEERTLVGVIGGIMLGLGRALGETMAVTFIIGNAYRISSSLYEPGNSIASALANEFNEAADPIHRASLITLGLVLFVLTLIVLALSRLLIAQLAKGEGRRT